MGGVIIPGTKIIGNPKIIYLAGPGKGGGDWQYKASEIIYKKSPESIIALPLEDLSKIKVPIIKEAESNFGRRNWELYHLDLALENGAAMFWFPEQAEQIPGKSYGLISVGEINYVSGLAKNNPNVKFCIGTDGKFTEWKTIERDLIHRFRNIRIFNTLEKTCEEAINISKT